MSANTGPEADGGADGAAPELSIVLPCLNEAETLPDCIARAREGLAAAGLRGEIVVVDNGSTDGSAEIARSLGARVVSEGARGYGAALRRGFASARARWIVMADADRSYDLRGVGAFAERLAEGYDLVMGSRIRGSIEPGAMPWAHRYVGTPALTRIVNALHGAGVSDVNCGMRGLDRGAALRLGLRSDGMELASEMVIRAAQAGLRIGETPIDFHRDGRSRPPHLRTIRDGWRHLSLILAMKFRRSR